MKINNIMEDEKEKKDKEDDWYEKLDEIIIEEKKNMKK